MKLRVTGDWLTDYLRWTKTPYEDAAKSGMALTAPQIKAIVDKCARIDGDTEVGLEYVETNGARPPRG